ncbi:MAG: nucleotidyltransferase domain-containing protein [Chloroflexi bacterium]|nr:nucleotidyltransferase domain-containing protein [Chloroflexota bacterium]
MAESAFEIALARIVMELDDGDTVGVALTGSHARGDPTDYSDVDVLRFVQCLPEQEGDRYRLEVRDGHLFSVTTTTVAEKTGELTRPEKAIWAVPGLRQARVLLDKEGSLAELKLEADDFSWGRFDRLPMST